MNLDLITGTSGAAQPSKPVLPAPEQGEGFADFFLNAAASDQEAEATAMTLADEAQANEDDLGSDNSVEGRHRDAHPDTVAPNAQPTKSFQTEQPRGSTADEAPTGTGTKANHADGGTHTTYPRTDRGIASTPAALFTGVQNDRATVIRVTGKPQDRVPANRGATAPSGPRLEVPANTSHPVATPEVALHSASVVESNTAKGSELTKSTPRAGLAEVSPRHSHAPSRFGAMMGTHAPDAVDSAASSTTSSVKVITVHTIVEQTQPQRADAQATSTSVDTAEHVKNVSVHHVGAKNPIAGQAPTATDKAPSTQGEKNKPSAATTALAEGDQPEGPSHGKKVDRVEISPSVAPKVKSGNQPVASQNPRVNAVRPTTVSFVPDAAKADLQAQTIVSQYSERVRSDPAGSAQAKVPASVQQIATQSIVDRHLNGQTATLITEGTQRGGGNEASTMPPTTLSVAEAAPKGQKPNRLSTLSVSQFAISAHHPKSEQQHPALVRGDQAADGAPLTIWGKSDVRPVLSARTAVKPLVQLPQTRVEGSARADTPFDAPSEIVWDVRGSNLATPTTHLAPLTKAEMPPHIPRQIAEAIHRSPEKTVEIALNPVELGRVRMVLSATDAGISVSILADRPDTLDLMRRNIDDLGQSFAELGYEDVSFSFEQGNHAENSDNTGDPPDTDMTTLEMPSGHPSAPAAPNPPRLSITPEGVDMRF
ncbi:flagellar hook-length control protein FliK [Tateyamaria sp. SN3-11]|uniref:flagellar hook-length control protein FliK n=1 Tax=Tateyamaria sp. SN3-11 TaxID=3092147 RepID=UPI0039E96CFF